jgi:glyoxylase-like metal-dependent hydrolase (beta-lactamase superfamily II)
VNNLKEIVKNVYHVGDSGCSVFLIDTQSDDGLVLIDCGMSLEIIKNISKNNLNPLDIRHCIITHFHIDHIGACSDLRKFNKKVLFYAHELDAEAIEERGHDRETAASWYGVTYHPIKLEKKLKGDRETLTFGSYNLECIHVPGHTPGSIAIFLELSDPKIKVLFGQDLHGPIIPGVSDYKDYQNSLNLLLDLNADILCEGHFGVFQPANSVRKYIEKYIR